MPAGCGLRNLFGSEVTMSKADQSSASPTPGDEVNARAAQPAAPLGDVHGPIPAFAPRAVDEQGRLMALTAEERSARSDAVLRALAALRDLPDDDPPDTLERLMRGLDAQRRPGRRLFEGMS
jgi:hypothetical protein